MSKGERKSDYFGKVKDLVEAHKSCFVVNVDNVSSSQMHQIRQSLRGDATILMGKNTLIRKAMRGLMSDKPEIENLLRYVVFNVGLVFTNGDLKDIRQKILANRVRAPAKAGVLAPCNVIVPAGSTGMDPSKTSFFQALNIATKIARGAIEIVSDVHLIKAGDKVGASEATLLNMLNISPFTYGMSVNMVYDNGVSFDPSVLDVDDDTLTKHFMAGVANVAALSLRLGIPTLASAPHVLLNTFKNVLAVSVATEYTFDASEKIKAYLADPSAFAVSAPAASTTTASAKEEAKPVEKEEESDEDMGFGLFD
jgi:large subunit ribosomal protein LP0